MNNVIHHTSIVHPNAKLGNNIVIGPFCIIGENVELLDGVVLKSHIVIEGITRIGKNNKIYPFASIGSAPQDLKYNGEASKLKIGENNIIREYVTIQPGTAGGGMLTEIGNDCLFMVGVHIAHDCKIGNKVIMANYASLGGHVEVGDYAVIGGLAAVAQFVRVGTHTMLGGLSGLNRDLIPYALASNERAALDGANLVGMKRRGFNTKDALEASDAIGEIFYDSEENFNDRIEKTLLKYSNNNIILEIISFLKKDTKKSFCKFKKSS